MTHAMTTPQLAELLTDHQRTTDELWAIKATQALMHGHSEVRGILTLTDAEIACVRAGTMATVHDAHSNRMLMLGVGPFWAIIAKTERGTLLFSGTTASASEPFAALFDTFEEAVEAALDGVSAISTALRGARQLSGRAARH